MTDDARTKALRESALTAIRGERRIGPHFKPVHFDIDVDGTATIEAEVDNVAIKRLALERLAATKGVSAVIDRLRVKPAQAMSDDGILDHLRKAYYDEPSFYELALTEREGGKLKLLRDAFETARGVIETEVKDVVIVLNGRVPSLAAKRLAGVIAWWVPGARDVVNGMPSSRRRRMRPSPSRRRSGSRSTRTRSSTRAKSVSAFVTGRSG